MERANWLADTEEIQAVQAAHNTLVLESPAGAERRASPQQSPRAGRISSPTSRTPKNSSPPPPPPPPPLEPSESTITEIVERLLQNGEWCKAFDAGSGKTYFYNPTTRATTWNLRALVERELVAHKGSTTPPSHLIIPAASSGLAARGSARSERARSAPRSSALEAARAASKQQHQPKRAGDSGGPPPSSRDDWRSRVVELYRRHNPSKLMVVDELLLRYAGREEELWRNLRSKYASGGSTPRAPSVPEAAAAPPSPERALFGHEGDDASATSPRLRGLSPSGDTAAVGTHNSHPRFRDDGASSHTRSATPEPRPASTKRRATPPTTRALASKAAPSPRATTPCTKPLPKRTLAFGRAVSPLVSATKTQAPPLTQSARSQAVRRPVPKAKRAGRPATAPRSPDDPCIEPCTPDAPSIALSGDNNAAQAATLHWQHRSPPASGRVSERLSGSPEHPRPTTPNPYSPQQQRGRRPSPAAQKRREDAPVSLLPREKEEDTDEAVEQHRVVDDPAEPPIVFLAQDAGDAAVDVDEVKKGLGETQDLEREGSTNDSTSVEDGGASLSPRTVAEEKARAILRGTSRQPRPAAALPRVARLSGTAARSPPTSSRSGGSAAARPGRLGAPRGTAAHHDAAWQEELLRREREAAARRDFLVEERQRAAQRRNSDLQRRREELQRIRDEERALRLQHLEARQSQQQHPERATSPAAARAPCRPRGEMLESRYRAALRRSSSAPSRSRGFDTSSPMFMNGWRVGRAIAPTTQVPEGETPKRRRLTRAELEKSAERLQRHYSSPAAKALAGANR